MNLTIQTLNVTFIWLQLHNFRCHYISTFVSQQGGGSIEEQPNENVTTEWFEALRADNLETVKRLLKSGKVDINCKDQVIVLYTEAKAKKKIQFQFSNRNDG